MKSYKHIIFTAIVLSLVALFAANQVIAHGESSEFYSGEEAGGVQAMNDFSRGICTVNVGFVSEKAKDASEDHAASLMNDNKSNDYIKGFHAGYERNWLSMASANCEN